MKAGPGLLIGAGVVLVLLLAAVGTPADADLWGHLRFGSDMLSAGSVYVADHYSFTADRVWINHEWLSEAIFAGVYRWAGAAGLIALKVVMIAAMSLVVWRGLRRAAPSPALRLLFVALACVGTYWRTHSVRPQLFSVLLFAVLMTLIAAVDAGRRSRLAALPVLFAIWVNLHGGWIVGLGVLGLWTAVRILEPRRAIGAWSLSQRALTGAAGLAAVAATLVNPYGVRLWMFLAETVRFGRPDIEEWGSILTYPSLLGIPWMLTVALALTAVIAARRAGRSIRLDALLIVASLGVASFRVSRLDAFFAVAAIVLLGPMLSTLPLFQRASAPALAPARPAGAAQAGPVLITAATLLVMMIPAASFIAPYATCLSVGGAWAPEPEAAAFVTRHQLQGRVLTWFDWGEYAIWHFGPALRVSFDGRRETVYSEATIQAHRRFYAADDTALPFLRQMNPDYIWVPVRVPIATKLNGSGWSAVFRGPVSIIFARDGAGIQPVSIPPPAASSTTAKRCFPGP